MPVYTKFPSIFVTGAASLFVLTALVAPMDVFAVVAKKYVTPSAVKGADEKNFVNTASRCLTPAMKNLNASMVKRMKADIAAAEIRLGKKFGYTLMSLKPQVVERRVCSSEDPSAARLCVVGPMAAGMGYRVEFYNLAGKQSDMIVISPVQGGVSSPTISVQADMTGAVASGTASFEGLPEGSYVAYGFTNPNGSEREASPRLSVSFTVDAKPVMTTSTSALVLDKKDPSVVYKEKMDAVWAAMSQPYCGFGSNGINAVKKSYNKSVEHIRAAFLKATIK